VQVLLITCIHDEDKCSHISRRTGLASALKGCVCNEETFSVEDRNKRHFVIFYKLCLKFYL